MQSNLGMKTANCRRTSVASRVLAALLVASASGSRRRRPMPGPFSRPWSDYVGSQETIRLTFDTDIEVITPQLEKISSPIPASCC